MEDDNSYKGPPVDAFGTPWTDANIVTDRDQEIWSAMCHSWRAKIMLAATKDPTVLRGALDKAEIGLLIRFKKVRYEAMKASSLDGML